VWAQIAKLFSQNCDEKEIKLIHLSSNKNNSLDYLKCDFHCLFDHQATTLEVGSTIKTY